MNTVGQILKSKGNAVWTISKDAWVSDAIQILVAKKVGAVLVLDGDALVGIFTERDYVQLVGGLGKSPDTLKIDTVMTKDLITVDPSQSVNTCMALMTDHHIRHLPVIQSGKLVGILSIGDVVKDIIEELEFMVEQFEKYVRGLR